MGRRRTDAPECGKSRIGQSSDLRSRAEERLAEEGLGTMLPADAKRLVHELQVHQIELEMQNEELQSAQSEIAESREKYVDLYDFAPVAYFSFDRNGVITEANLTGASIVGIERAYLIGKPFSPFVSPQDRDIFYTHCRTTQKTGQAEKCDLLIQRKDGSRIPVLMESIAVSDAMGNTTIRSAVTNIAERKQAEDAVHKSRDQLELMVRERTAELQESYDRLVHETMEREHLEEQLRHGQKMEALGTLTGGIAHDFNNMLAAIMGFTELAADDVVKGSLQAHHLEKVMEASFRGRDLVRQMLAYARQTEQEKKPLRLSGIVTETVEFLRASTPSTIKLRVAAKSESGPILGDPTQIQQVLMNLCTNAVHAMREKGGVLDIEFSDFSVPASHGFHGMMPGPYMRLLVRDTGKGIPPDILDKIFDPFFTTKGPGEGTGLGLSVVQGIVKQSKGYITVVSQPGKGSTFTVHFPRITEDAATDAPSDEEIPAGSERILFLDDDETLVETGEKTLIRLGYAVTSRTSSREALALLKEDPSLFDLVITDQTMPEMTGVDLARKILILRPDMPIIMSTGFSHLVDADKAKAAGIRAFAMKPLSKREIAKTIRKVLDE